MPAHNLAGRQRLPLKLSKRGGFAVHPDASGDPVRACGCGGRSTALWSTLARRLAPAGMARAKIAVSSASTRTQSATLPVARRGTRSERLHRWRLST
jgi:hypothetical protein